MLEDFLNAKPLFYDEIDYTRMPRVYKRIQKNFDLAKIIHIVGTNGKGTSGRFLATALSRLGYNTGHYTSPHILKFNERIWFNGNDVSMELLEDTHRELLTLLTQDEVTSLSYFEYTTLLAMLFFSSKCDYIILEAGLGGEYDATAVFTNLLTVVTPIDIDHESFLGKDIRAIAQTKLNAIQKTALLAKQTYKEVQEVLLELQLQKEIKAYYFDELLDQQDYENIQSIAQDEHLPAYLQDNLALSIAVLKYLHIAYKKEDFYNARLFGRLTELKKNIIIDVGHNVLAARSIVKSLEGKKYILVYNSYKDKNYKEILRILKPIITSVSLIDVYNNRIEESSYLQDTLDELAIQWDTFTTTNADESYLVFGSFSVVEAFLRSEHG